MKKSIQPKKFQLATETVKQLEAKDLARVAGGGVHNALPTTTVLTTGRC